MTTFVIMNGHKPMVNTNSTMMCYASKGQALKRLESLKLIGCCGLSIKGYGVNSFYALWHRFYN